MVQFIKKFNLEDWKEAPAYFLLADIKIVRK